MPCTVARWLILQKARRHSAKWLLRLLVGARFQVLFHSPPGVLFTFPSRYWSTIGHRQYLALEGGPPSFGPSFTCSDLLGNIRCGQVAFRIRGSHPVPPAFPCRSAKRLLRIPHGRVRALPWYAPQPPGGNASPLTRARVWAHLRFRSPLLAQSRLISLPPLT